MKLKTIFLMLVGVLALDYLTTFIGLNFVEGLAEQSQIPAYFFSLGWYGWIVDMVLYSSMMLLMAMFIFNTQHFLNRKERKKKFPVNSVEELNKFGGMGFFIAWIGVGVFVVSELFVIISNISNIVAVV